MNRMRTTGSRKISDTFDSDACALQRTAAVGGTSMLREKDVELGRSRTSQTAPIGVPRIEPQPRVRLALMGAGMAC